MISNSFFVLITFLTTVTECPVKQLREGRPVWLLVSQVSILHDEEDTMHAGAVPSEGRECAVVAAHMVANQEAESGELE